MTDNNLKSMVTDIPKTDLAATSYGQTHPERVSLLPDMSVKAILSQDLAQILDTCSERTAAKQSKLRQSVVAHKYRHYKYQKGHSIQSNNSSSGEKRGATPSQDIESTKYNSEHRNISRPYLKFCKSDMRVFAVSTDSPAVSESVYDFNDAGDDFADAADNFTMRIGAIPEDFRVYPGRMAVPDPSSSGSD